MSDNKVELMPTPSGSRQVQVVDVSDLKPRSRNPRVHSQKQLLQIAASIETFGFVNPVLIDSKCEIIAGHARVEAAKIIGLKQIPTVMVDHLSPAELRAYVIADNKLAENAGWDRELLALEIKELAIEVDLDIRLTGFETAEIDLLLKDTSSDTEAEVPAPVEQTHPAITRQGDVWQIGKHRLICGDARDPTVFAALLEGQKASCVFTDPPYNVSIDGHVSGLGAARHREFAMASGEMTNTQFANFLSQVFLNLKNFSSDGSLHFVCMDWRHLTEVHSAARDNRLEVKNLCVWVKTNAGMGSLYRSQHELVFVLKNGDAPHINNIELGKYGRHRTNVWTYAGMNSFGSERSERLAMHPTVKPLALVKDALLDATNRNDIVLDAFAGSGTTLLAAHQTGRRGYGIEIDPHYVDLVIARFERECGLAATHVESGVRWAEIREARAQQANDL